MEKVKRSGKLILQDNERYGIVTKELTCGSPIEAFIDGQLIKGRIEGRFDWDNNGAYEYYLLGDDDKSYNLKNEIEVIFVD